MKIVSSVLGCCLWISCPQLSGGGEHLHFPWANHGHGAEPMLAPPNQPPHQVISPAPQHHHRAVPPALQHLPSKPAYAYGWFGSNPHLGWHRHIGYSRNYTQWTSR